MNKMVALRKKLMDNPIGGATVLILLFYGFFTISMLVYYYISYYIGFVFNNISFVLLFFTRFAISFSLLGIYCIVIIPIGLHLPDGKQSIKKYLISIKIKKDNKIKRKIIIGIGCGISYGIFYFIGFLIVSESFPSFNFITIFGMPKDASGLGVLFFVSALTWAIWEEILFRGVILTTLLKKYAIKKAIIIDSVIFGLYHLFNLIGGVNFFFILFQVASATFGGFIYAYLCTKTENLIPSIICHYLHNSFLFIMEEWFSNVLILDVIFVQLITRVFGGFFSLILNYFIIKRRIREKRILIR